MFNFDLTPKIISESSKTTISDTSIFGKSVFGVYSLLFGGKT